MGFEQDAYVRNLENLSLRRSRRFQEAPTKGYPVGEQPPKFPPLESARKRQIWEESQAYRQKVWIQTIVGSTIFLLILYLVST